jgi:pimeloyl-ACP methyl ester carboxylesterase
MSQAFGWDASVIESGARRSLAPDGQGGFLRRPAPAAIRALMAPLENWDMFADLAALTTPSLILQGGRMPPVHHLPPEQRELTEALVAGINRELAPYRMEGPVRAIRLEDAGHMLHFDAPAEVARHIRTIAESSARQ